MRGFGLCSISQSHMISFVLSSSALVGGHHNTSSGIAPLFTDEPIIPEVPPVPIPVGQLLDSLSYGEWEREWRMHVW